MIKVDAFTFSKDIYFQLNPFTILKKNTNKIKLVKNDLVLSNVCLKTVLKVVKF